MTDLEMTKLCAEAMGLDHSEWSHITPHTSPSSVAARSSGDDRYTSFDPLVDDADAMALLKYFPISVSEAIWAHGSTPKPNFNRAIVECVAMGEKP